MAPKHTANPRRATISTQKVAMVIVTAIPAFVTLMSGIMKVMQNPEAVKMLNEWHLDEYALALGFIEVGSVLIFLVPQTRRFGFFLLASYFGGAIATCLQQGLSPLIPMAILALYCGSIHLSDPGLFTKSSELRS